MLNVRGISYLVGEASIGDVRRDMAVVAQEPHRTTVMVIGDGKRLTDAARTALESGLGVHIRPSLPELPQPEMLKHLEAVADAAEELRREHPDRVTLLVGSEFSHTLRNPADDDRRLWHAPPHGRCAHRRLVVRNSAGAGAIRRLRGERRSWCRARGGRAWDPVREIGAMHHCPSLPVRPWCPAFMSPVPGEG